jgi:lipopolysaccharide exporter
VTSTVAPKRVLVGGTWLIAARAVDRLIGIVSISVLARLLKPLDFGVVAIAGTVVAAVELLSTFGFDWALVRHQHPSREDLNSAWTLRVIFGLFTLIALTLLASPAAVFYRQPALKAVLIAMGGTSFIASLENIGTVYFRRDSAFHKEFLMRAAAKLIGFCVTLAAALRYHSYWALIAGVFALRATFVGMSYLMHPFRPRPSLKNSRELFGFSLWILFGNVIEYCRERFSDLYIGRVYGAATNGLFAVAGEISIVPITEVAAPINRAAYSKYAEDVRANRALGPSYVSIASMIWMISLPMAVGIAAVAPEIIRLLLGPRWQGAQIVLQWLAVGGAFTVMIANTHYVYWALGHTRAVAALSAAGVAVVVPATIVCSHLAGYAGVAFAFAIASALLVPINFVVLRRLSGIGFGDLWPQVWRIILGTAAMGTVLRLVFGASGLLDVKAALVLLVAKILTGATTYAAVVCIAWLACGRPLGPEHAVAELLVRAAGRGKRRYAGGAP